MRQDNEVKGLRSLSSHASSLRARLTDTPRRAVASGLAAAVAIGALMMSATHLAAAQAETAKMAMITHAAPDRPAKSGEDSAAALVIRSFNRAAYMKAAAAAEKAAAKRKAAAVARTK